MFSSSARYSCKENPRSCRTTPQGSAVSRREHCAYSTRTPLALAFSSRRSSVWVFPDPGPPSMKRMPPRPSPTSATKSSIAMVTSPRAGSDLDTRAAPDSYLRLQVKCKGPFFLLEANGIFSFDCPVTAEVSLNVYECQLHRNPLSEFGHTER